jgi:hypothetical protein
METKMFKIQPLIVVLLFLNFQVKAEESFDEQFNKVMDSNFETLTKGMTPEMKERYKSQMELAKKEMAKYNKLTLEERKKIDEENQKLMKDPKSAERIKNNLSSLSSEDKAMLNVMANNLNDEINTIKNPPLKKQNLENKLRMEKLNIRTGVPNILVIPDEKLTGLGNNEVKSLKIKYSELISEMNKINVIEVNTYCTSELDCMAMAYGQQLNGGPAGFIYMSKNDINSKAIMSRVNNFTELDKNIQSNLKGFIYTGKKKEWPDLGCIQNVCREKLPQ